MLGIKTKLLLNASRVHLRRYNAEFASTIPSGSLVLDAGAGTAPYRDLFAHTRYETADFERVDKSYGTSTYVCDLTSIPVEDGRFDFIVFNQVLEHLPEPLKALRELARVLKDGGRIICSAPLFYEEHEHPFDFYRYTQFAYRHLFPQVGLRIDRLEWLEGYLATVAYQLDSAQRYLPRRPREIAPGPLGFLCWPILLSCRIAFVFLAALFYRLDVRQKYVSWGFPKNYVVIATKDACPRDESGQLRPRDPVRVSGDRNHI